MDYTTFTKTINESLESSQDFYMTTNTKLPNIVETAFSFDGVDYLVVIKRTSAKGLYTLELGRVVNKKMKIWGITNPKHLRPVIATVFRVVEASIPFLGNQLSGIAIKFPKKMKKNIAPLVGKVLLKSHQKQFFASVNVDNTDAKGLYQYAFIYRKRKDPTIIFKSKAFDGYDFDAKKEIPADALSEPKEIGVEKPLKTLEPMDVSKTSPDEESIEDLMKDIKVDDDKPMSINKVDVETKKVEKEEKVEKVNAVVTGNESADEAIYQLAIQAWGTDLASLKNQVKRMVSDSYSQRGIACYWPETKIMKKNGKLTSHKINKLKNILEPHGLGKNFNLTTYNKSVASGSDITQYIQKAGKRLLKDVFGEEAVITDASKVKVVVVDDLSEEDKFYKSQFGFDIGSGVRNYIAFLISKYRAPYTHKVFKQLHKQLYTTKTPDEAFTSAANMMDSNYVKTLFSEEEFDKIIKALKDNDSMDKLYNSSSFKKSWVYNDGFRHVYLAAYKVAESFILDGNKGDVHQVYKQFIIDNFLSGDTAKILEATRPKGLEDSKEKKPLYKKKNIADVVVNVPEDKFHEKIGGEVVDVLEFNKKNNIEKPNPPVKMVNAIVGDVEDSYISLNTKIRIALGEVLKFSTRFNMSLIEELNEKTQKGKLDASMKRLAQLIRSKENVIEEYGDDLSETQQKLLSMCYDLLESQRIYPYDKEKYGLVSDIYDLRNYVETALSYLKNEIKYYHGGEPVLHKMLDDVPELDDVITDESAEKVKEIDNLNGNYGAVNDKHYGKQELEILTTEYEKEFEKMKDPDDTFDSVKAYTGSSYYDINQMLRKPNTIKNMAQDHVEHYGKHVVKIIEAFENVKPLEKGMWVSRGTDIPNTTPLPDNAWDINQTYVDSGCLSTSLIIPTGWGGQTLFLIYIPKGAKVIPILNNSNHDGEREIILPPMSHLKPIDVKVSSDKSKQVIKCVYVGNKAAFHAETIKEKLSEKGLTEEKKYDYMSFINEAKRMKDKKEDKKEESFKSKKWLDSVSIKDVKETIKKTAKAKLKL